MTPTTRSFTERHRRQLAESRRSNNPAGPRPGETVADWMVRRFQEIMRSHLCEHTRERESAR